MTWIRSFYPICLIFKDEKRWRWAEDRGIHGACICFWLSPLPTVECLRMNLLEAIIKNNIKIIKIKMYSFISAGQRGREEECFG